MPAYRGQVGARDLDDLVAYVLAVSQFGWPEDSRVTRGRDLALQMGCLGCHGPEGRGLVTNVQWVRENPRAQGMSARSGDGDNAP